MASDRPGQSHRHSPGPGPGPGPGASSALARLRAVLAHAARGDAVGESGPTPRELAEVLWLAGQLSGNGDDDVGAEDSRPTGVALPPPTPEPEPGGGAAPAVPDDVSPDLDAGLPEVADGRVPLHLPASRTAEAAEAAGGTGTPLFAPAPPMLHHPLALQRALRPLKRKVPSPHARVLDEDATADRIARLGAHPDAWLPVLRPAPDRWLRLNLVHDTGPTMPVWRPLVRELHTVLVQSGIFRTVTLHRADPDGRARQVPDLADGRTVTLVVSDCMGPQWRPGPAGDRWYRTLRRWSARMPLAVVQPLPEHLWHTTALPAEPGLLTPPAAAAPSATLTFTPYDPDATPPPPSAVPLPVLEPAPSWLAHWAALISDPGGRRTPGAAGWLAPDPVPPAEATRDIASLDPKELVLRFRGTASPEAVRLAGHLSLAVPALPVMRLVQHALLRDPRPQHLAEIILSGMLTAVPGPPGSYAFRPGVRDLLRRSLPRTARGRTREFLARVGGLIDERAGLAAGEFRAEARHGPQRPAGPTDDDSAFATVSEDTVRRLGGGDPDDELFDGRYRLVGPLGQGRRVWEAVDGETGRQVAVHTYPAHTVPLERFSREADALAALTDPHVVPVLRFGTEGRTRFLVTEFVDGVSLSELEHGNGPLPFPVFARLACHVVSGLQALHRQGLVRGTRGRDGLLLRPDGTVMISRFALEQQPDSRTGELDFREFGSLLRELAARVVAPYQFQPHLDVIAEGGLPDARDAAAPLSAWRDPRPPTVQYPDNHLRFTLLGPLRISLRDEPRNTPSPEARAMLCMLLLAPGRTVRHGELAYGLWKKPPPGDEIREHLHGLATELRRVLGPGVLATADNGYALHVPDAYVDVLLCDDLLDQRSADQEPRVQRALIQQVLDLFYGDPLDGVPGPAAAAASARLRTLRLALCADRAQLDIALGDFDRATADLLALLRDHPDHEEFRRLRALALRHRERAAEPARDRDLVRGPFPLRPTTAVPGPAEGRTAVVLATSDGELIPLEPGVQPSPRGRPTQYYEVDLTTHRVTHAVSLPSSSGGVLAASVELSWQVEDPVAFVRGETTRVLDRLLDHVVREASRLTRRRPVPEAADVQQAVLDGLRNWPVPGLAVACSVRLTPEGGSQDAPRSVPHGTPTPADLLRDADAVLLGFDGPLTRLFSRSAARSAALELVSLVVENRDPEDALAGDVLDRESGAATVHPLDVLRTFAGLPLGSVLEQRLDRLEREAAAKAPLTRHATDLVRVLRDSGRPVSVVTDVGPAAVQRFLTHRFLDRDRIPLAGVHGRGDLGRLMPDPDCIRRALRDTDTPAAAGVVIGSSVAEFAAAVRAETRFIGYAPTTGAERHLRQAGCEVTVPSLAPLLEAARAL